MQLEIETSRLILRPKGLDDSDFGVELLCDPEVMKFVGETLTPEEVRSNIQFVKRAAGGALGIWIAEDRVSGEKIGDGLLLPLPIEAEDTEWDLMQSNTMPNREIEVGYILKPSAWGKGYATEICQALLDFGFEHLPLDEIAAVTDPDNHPSCHVLRKCGLIDHGLRRAYAGETTDFRITRTQWEQNRDA